MQKIKFLQRIICVLFLNLLCFGPLSLPMSAQDLNGAKVTLSMHDATVEDFANEVAKQTGLNVKFADEGVKALKGVTLDVRDQSVSSLLLNLANQFPLSYTVEGNTLTLAKKETTQRKGGVRGQVTDNNGDPIIGAVIRVDGVNGGYVTDINGEYEIVTDLKEVHMNVSYIGYKTVTKTVKNGATANITLREDSKEMQEVVVTGYQTKNKNSFTGSQAFELMQNVSESLAGRIAVLKLNGLSWREMRGDDFQTAFVPDEGYLADRKPVFSLPEHENIWQIIHRGDMPRLYEQPATDWQVYYASYVATYIERDVRQLVNVGSSGDFTRFMIAIAARSGELLNYSSVAQEIGVSVDTVKRWLTVLQTSGIVYLLQPYGNNHLKRAIKTPKVYMLNTGLMAYLTKWLTPETIQNGAKSGQFFETFVVGEIIKSFHNQGQEPPIYFYRDTNQKEIDLLIEHQQMLYPVEIKATANPNKKMAAAFNLLRNTLPANELGIAHGTIINQYPQKIWLAENLVAVPAAYV